MLATMFCWMFNCTKNGDWQPFEKIHHLKRQKVNQGQIKVMARTAERERM